MQKLVLLFLIIFSSLISQQDIASVKFIAPQSAFEAGKSYTLLFEFDIDETWHVNSHSPRESWAIPTELQISSSNPLVSIGKINYPKDLNRKFSFSDKMLNVYEGREFLKFSISISPDLPEGAHLLNGIFTYQGCNDATCLAPVDLPVKFELQVTTDPDTIKILNSDLFSSPETIDKGGKRGSSGESDLSDLYNKQGMFLYLFFVFIAGLALNLTPCVFPLIPITISYFGNKSEGKKSTLAIHGALYALGMAITYSLLGTFAAMAGDIIGSAMQSPITGTIIVLVILALAASMFGAFEIRVPQSLAQLGGKNRSGFGGTLLMGLTVGIIAAPCIGPFVLALVTFVAQSGNWFFGFISFFVLALGLGLPYAILALFTSSITSLPRAGMWMIWVRKIFGFILLGLAIYFIAPLIQNEMIYSMLMAITMIIASIYLTFVDKTEGTGGWFKYLKTTIGIIFLLIGLNYGLESHKLYLENNDTTVLKENVLWEKYSEGIISRAKAEKKPVFIDFYADWCEPCKELEHSTFRDKNFEMISGNFLMIKADLTNNKDPKVEKLRKEYGVRGVPTLIIVDGEGNIGKTFVGFQEPGTLVSAMKKFIR